MSAGMQKQLRKLLKISSSAEIPPVDGEILYSTNNVCIHPQGLLSNTFLHHPGFLTISAKVGTDFITLMINWNPNSLKVGEGKENKTTVAYSCDKIDSCGKNIESDRCSAVSGPCDCSNGVSESDSPILSVCNSPISEFGGMTCIGDSNVERPALLQNTLLSLDRSNSQSSNLDSLCSDFDVQEMQNLPPDTPLYQGHVIRPPKNQLSCPFAIDLGEMRSLGIYFRNPECTKGEFIIASHESLYRVLHFHNGGLDSVAKVLKNWRNVTKRFRHNTVDLSIRYFTVVKSQLTLQECHPEEDLYRGLSTTSWDLYTDEFGRVEDETNVQKAVFFGGVDKELRRHVWPYLLKFYRYDMTVLEKADLRVKRLSKYEMINAKRENMLQLQEKESFWRNVICSIEKDVLRTDRSKPFFKGEGNPNLDILHRILLNYAIYTKTAYTQGMSDLLAPLLIEINDESDVFWCFVGLMQHTIFISSPSDHDMEKQLLYLRELLRLIVPDFHAHLLTCGPGAMELLFTHRWILLCFKREFPEHEALKIWEACWAHYQNSYFHLFVCIAIIMLYGKDITQHKLASDEILLHFTHLAMQMNGSLVLRKARGLLHAFRMRDSIPCTLYDICFNEQHKNCCNNIRRPKIKCQGTEDCLDGCLYGGSTDAVGMLRMNVSKFFNPTK